MTSAPRAVGSSVNGWNPEFLDEQYRLFRINPDALPADLRAFFQGFDLGASAPGGAAAGPVGEASPFQAKVGDLIEAYRTVGHIAAKLDPFGRDRPRPDLLTLEYHGLGENDLGREVDAESVGLGGRVTLRELIAHLEDRYCGTIGVEVMHISNAEERNWLLDRFERGVDRAPLTRAEKAHLLEQLVRAESFENFLGRRYPGDKRFSLEGSEGLIPLLDRLLEQAASLGVEELVLAMAHRGRLNVLNNVMGKTYEQIFTEFEDSYEPAFANGGGDVKYHRGYSGTRLLPSGRTVRLVMASNPSHLEAVDPVVLGRCRAKQRLKGDTDQEGHTGRKRVMPLIIHGDAAVAGQGVVAETLNLSQLKGYAVGGTVHVVVNNLIGFTTSPDDARSTRYCTDIAKAFEAPVLHVNGEDPEATIACAHFAAEYRQRFGKDIFIDMWCYRRYGHNEQDEASFTQPILAALIKGQPSVLDTYAGRLLAEGVITEQDVQAIKTRLDDALDAAQRHAKTNPVDPTIDPGSFRWIGMGQAYAHTPVDTAVSRELIEEVCQSLGRVPEGFNVNPKLVRLLDERRNLPRTGKLCHADAELLAFGTLLLEGHPVRLSGQDSRRGTFSQRHAALFDSTTREMYVPLDNIRPNRVPIDNLEAGNNHDTTAQAQFCVHDSPLSEYAVLGFEYGYALADPGMLVLWEAQFGDFNNGAQITIDQFIASAEIKWERWNGLVLLLPHGYEGAGPEHSSARLERFLQLCGDDNIQVVYPSTAAQTFHMLRRQLKRGFRKPLIVMTPKSMLRVTTSTLDECVQGRFLDVIDDPAHPGNQPVKGVKRIVLCTGKLYHELAARRDEIGREDVAIIRIEQLYPLDTPMLREILDRYPASAEVVWAQEEPRNMGAFAFISDRLREELKILEIRYIGRPTSATPSSGSKKLDRNQQESILTHAIGPKTGASPAANQARPADSKPVPAA
ncbi:MAG: 2-oxoglutarate dehydrogenase E1 component [Phycisphaeraceae bacterium]|nr:2-oxoglutarate dehydrogenase E1 component [Phycisphaeraceae bacterium]